MRAAGRGPRLRNGLAIAAIVAIQLLPTPSAAQEAVTVSAGPAQYDLSGTGWSGVTDVRFDFALRPWLKGVVGTGLFWYSPQGGGTDVLLLPGAGLAVHPPSGVPLFLEVGAGVSATVRGDRRNALTVHGALGVAVPVADEWQVRPEVRLRVVDPFVGGIAGFQLGVTRLLK